LRRGLCLDAGALIAIERRDRRVLRLLEMALAAGYAVDVPVGVVGQVWRGGNRQAQLARFLRLDDVGFVELDLLTARAIGELCALTGATDVVDSHVALHARRHALAVVTSDPDDFAALAGELDVIAV
jgi:predicted nucleic acid-binding protein